MASNTNEMEAQQVTVLVADDDEEIRSVLVHHLTLAGYRCLTAAHGKEALARMIDEVAVVLLDLRMPGLNGFECLNYIREHYKNTETIIFTASQEIADAVKAMKGGAFDYVTKPLNFDAVIALVQQAARTARLSEENRLLKQVIGDSKPLSSFIGDSPEMRKVLRQTAKVSGLDTTVLITGESGVGKSLLARMIHYQSPRAEKPFVTVSCTALPRDLVEAELFGHEKGAFTGAHERRLGRIEIANGGTLFLDEIGDMPLDLQPKLLTFLQERTFHRIGGNKPITADVRIVAATNQDLQQRVKEKQFREDLYFRIHVIPFHIPPLRNRPGDIPLLTDHLLRQIARRRRSSLFELAPEARKALEVYTWPGNVRELENALERASAFCTQNRIAFEDLPPHIAHPLQGQPAGATYLGGLALEEVEKMAIEQTLQFCGGNKAKASRQLGISEKSIYNKMKRLGIPG